MNKSSKIYQRILNTATILHLSLGPHTLIFGHLMLLLSSDGLLVSSKCINVVHSLHSFVKINTCLKKRHLLPITFAGRNKNDALFHCSSIECIRMIDTVRSLSFKETMITLLDDLSVELFYEIFSYSIS